VAFLRPDTGEDAPSGQPASNAPWLAGPRQPTPLISIRSTSSRQDSCTLAGPCLNSGRTSRQAACRGATTAGNKGLGGAGHSPQTRRPFSSTEANGSCWLCAPPHRSPPSGGGAPQVPRHRTKPRSYLIHRPCCLPRRDPQLLPRKASTRRPGLTMTFAMLCQYDRAVVPGVPGNETGDKTRRCQDLAEAAAPGCGRQCRSRYH